jgi:heme-degrading monooxygenase HmoA
MIELLSQPPPADAIARMAAIEGVRMTPGVLASQRGPDGDLGPEAAGAILVLQATFDDEDGFAEFWRAAASMMEVLATAPGFIRRYSFADGPLYHLIAFWRSPADAHAFFMREEHQAAMRELFEHRWQYSHFAALWELPTPRQRVIFCRSCDGVTPATDGVCGGCGTELFDPFVGTSPVEG